MLPQLEEESLFNLVDDYDGRRGIGFWLRSGSSGATWYAPGTTNMQAIASRPAVFVCPTDTAEPYAQTTLLGSTYPIPAGEKAAVGSYSFVAGNKGIKQQAGITNDSKYVNNGMFYYVATNSFRTCSDGLSKTLMIGEVIDGHLSATTNIWSRAIRARDCQRYTDNPINLLPGQPVTVSDSSSGSNVQIQGSFASRHTGGCQFALGDGSVQFLRETIDQKIYEAMSTRDASLWPYSTPEPVSKLD
jgi:prepilin-type processing-associated H-X9-DG protein